MSLHLDPKRQAEHRRRNLTHTYLLVAGLVLLVSVTLYLVWGLGGIIIGVVIVGAAAFFAPRVPGEVIMRLYKAKPVAGTSGTQIQSLMAEIARRAELPVVPRLYVVPSATLNAFATGSREKPVIAVTEGMLRKLSLRELVGVLAHEVSHIRNNDVAIMAPRRHHEPDYADDVVFRGGVAHLLSPGSNIGDRPHTLGGHSIALSGADVCKSTAAGPLTCARV